MPAVALSPTTPRAVHERRAAARASGAATATTRGRRPVATIRPPSAAARRCTRPIGAPNWGRDGSIWA